MTLAIIDNGTDGALALKKNMLSTNEKLALHSFGVAGEENPYEETIKPKKETSNKSTGSIAPEMSTTVEKEQEFPSDEKAADVAAAIAEKEGTIGAVVRLKIIRCSLSLLISTTFTDLFFLTNQSAD